MTNEERENLDKAIVAIMVATTGTWVVSNLIANGLKHLGINVDGRAIWRAMVRIATYPPKGYTFDWNQGSGGHRPVGSRARWTMCDEYRLIPIG